MQETPEGLASNESVIVHLPGPLDVAALRQSLNEILRRHGAWRTSFPVLDGQPVQMIYPALPLTLPLVDLRHLPEAERGTEALHLATVKARMPFDLAGGPLLRATLIQLADQEHQLYLTLHHIIFDGAALFQTFLRELRTLYEAFSTGRPSPLPELPIQCADLALRQQEWLQGDVASDQLAFWKQELAGAPGALELPGDRPRPPVETHRGSKYPFALSRQLTASLKALGRREGVSLFVTLVAAFNTLLHRYTGQDDLLIGTVSAGRKRREAEGLLGFLPNTLVLRTDLAGDPTFRELLERVREVILRAEAHQEVPFYFLVKELRPGQEFGQNPFYRVMLTLRPSPPALPSGWTLTHMENSTRKGTCDLSLNFEDRPEGLAGRLAYSTDLFDEPTMARMAGHLQTLLQGIVDDPEQRLSQLPLLAEAERQQLLVEWNSTWATYPKDQSIPRLFEAQVERTPDAVALVFEGQELTYRELSARANQLAHQLQALGV